jgi:AcrR family transcriptional regulator
MAAAAGGIVALQWPRGTGCQGARHREDRRHARLGRDYDVVACCRRGIDKKGRVSLLTFNVISNNEARGGRPRDPDKDAAVHRAVRKLLAEKGYQATTIPAVARAAGVGAPTIYRRWSSQSAMVESALSYRLDPPSIDNSGDFDAYLRSFVEAVVGYFADPATRAAVPGLLVEYYREPGRYASLVVQAEDPIRELFRAAHADAVTDGTVAPEPAADSLFDTIIGIVLYHGIWRHSANEHLVEEILDVVLSACRLATAGSTLSRRRKR